MTPHTAFALGMLTGIVMMLGVITAVVLMGCRDIDRDAGISWEPDQTRVYKRWHL